MTNPFNLDTHKARMPKGADVTFDQLLTEHEADVRTLLGAVVKSMAALVAGGLSLDGGGETYIHFDLTGARPALAVDRIESVQDQSPKILATLYLPRAWGSAWLPITLSSLREDGTYVLTATSSAR